MIEFFKLIIKKEGAILLYLIFSLVITLKNMKKIIFKRKVEQTQLFFGITFISISLFALFSLFNDVIINYSRILKYSVFIWASY